MRSRSALTRDNTAAKLLDTLRNCLFGPLLKKIVCGGSIFDLLQNIESPMLQNFKLNFKLFVIFLSSWVSDTANVRLTVRLPDHVILLEV